MIKSNTGLASLPNEILFQIFGIVGTKSLIPLLGTCQHLRLIGVREIQFRLMPTIARDDIFLNLLLDIPQFRTSSPYMTLRPSGLRILKPNDRTSSSDSKIQDLSAQYLCLDINSQLYNDPGNGPADRGQRIIRRPPHCTSGTTVIAQNASQKVEREMIVEDFEDFGQFCIALNIVFQRSASSFRRARIFHEGFTRIAKSELETQAKGRPVRSAASLAANASDRVFWVGSELKVGVNIVVKRQEIFQPLPRESESDSCGVKTGPLHKFTLGIKELHIHMLSFLVALDELRQLTI